ncbi:MAG TPA: YwiC-like family protein [Acidimicrobiales bacterium]
MSSDVEVGTTPAAPEDAPGEALPDSSATTTPRRAPQRPPERRSARSQPAGRSPLRAVALPAEHGGWGLTAEPALLGLIIAPTVAGGALTAAAFVAFLARTPLKLALVDRWRRRRLPRSALAERVAAVELAALAALVAWAAATASGRFWVPLVVAAPLVAVELWFDMRSRGRRLLPELAGSVGIAAVAAAIVLAAGDGGAHGEGARLATGLWIVLAARALAALPYVHTQLARAKGRPHHLGRSDAAQVAGLVVGGIAVALDGRLVVGLAALAVLVVVHVVTARRTPPPAVVLGIRQTVLGLVVVGATAAGVIAL